MTREKIESAQRELSASRNMVIVFIMGFIEKEIAENAIITRDPKTVDEWKPITNFHPERGLIIASSNEDYQTGDVVYLDATRRGMAAPLLHNGEVYYVVSSGSILSKVTGPGAEVILEKTEIPRRYTNGCI